MIAGEHIPSGGKNWIKTAAYTGMIILLFLLPLFVDSVYYLHTFIITLIYTIAACSLRTIMVRSGCAAPGRAMRARARISSGCGLSFNSTAA